MADRDKMEEFGSESRVTKVIALVGGQTLPIALPILASKPQNLVLICSDRTTDQAWWISNALKSLIQDRRVVHVDPFDVDSVRKAIRQHAEEGELGTTVNLTGGTKIMSIGAALEAQDRNLPWEYLSMERRCIVTPSGARPLNAAAFSELTVPMYLTLMGCSLGPRTGRPLSALSSVEIQMAEVIASAACSGRWFGNVRMALVEALRRGHGGRWFTRPGRDLVQFARGLERLRVAQVKQQGTRLEVAVYSRFRDALAAQLDGFWLEVWTASSVEKAGAIDVRIAAKVRLADGTTTNEIDVLCIYEGRLVVLECKTGRSWESAIVLQREQLRRQLGGDYSLAGFVLHGPRMGGRTNRIQGLGMFLAFTSDQLRELPKHLDKYFRDAGPAV